MTLAGGLPAAEKPVGELDSCGIVVVPLMEKIW